MSTPDMSMDAPHGVEFDFTMPPDLPPGSDLSMCGKNGAACTLDEQCCSHNCRVLFGECEA